MSVSFTIFKSKLKEFLINGYDLTKSKTIFFWRYSSFLSFLFCFRKKILFFFLVLDGGGSLSISLFIGELLLRQRYLNS